MKRDIESLGRIRLQGLALLGLTFLIGTLVGVAGDRALLQPERPSHPFGPGRVSFDGIRGTHSTLPPHLERLNLSNEQRAAIVAILERTRPTTDSILGTFLPRLRAVRDSIGEAIRVVLTPEQRERLERDFPRLRGPNRPSPPAGSGSPKRGPTR